MVTVANIGSSLSNWNTVILYKTWTKQCDLTEEKSYHLNHNHYCVFY